MALAKNLEYGTLVQVIKGNRIGVVVQAPTGPLDMVIVVFSGTPGDYNYCMPGELVRVIRIEAYEILED